jgi:hypothetical protein
MSEHKQEKWLYSFIIPKEVEVEKQVEETLNNEQVKVTRKVKEKQNVKFALKRPNRRLYERADLFYGVQLADGIRAGLLTKALLLKRYRNDGGALSEGDTAQFHALGQQLAVLEENHQRYIANFEKLPQEENEKRIKEVFQKKRDVLQELQAFESINRALFAHTAETKADVQQTNWWTTNLAYWDKAGDGNFVEFFEGETFEDRMKKWDEFYDSGDPFLLEILARFSIIIGLWNAGATTQDEFEDGQKTQIPTEETKTEVKVEAPAPATSAS